MDSLPPDRTVRRPPSGNGSTHTQGDALRFGFRTACWLKVAYPTFGLRALLSPLPPTRSLRHGEFVHVLYDVDAWSRAGCITREDVVARMRSVLLTGDVAHEMALGHFVCESTDDAHDNEEIREALRSG